MAGTDLELLGQSRLLGDGDRGISSLDAGIEGDEGNEENQQGQ